MVEPELTVVVGVPAVSLEGADPGVVQAPVLEHKHPWILVQVCPDELVARRVPDFEDAHVVGAERVLDDEGVRKRLGDGIDVHRTSERADKGC